MRTVEATLVGERHDLRLGWDVKPVGVGRFPRYSWRWPVVTALDGMLVDGPSRPADCPESASLLAAAADLSTVVVADEDAVYVRSPVGARTVPVRRADSATLIGGRRALVTGRLDDHRQRAYVLATDGWDIIDEIDLDTYQAEITSLTHPHDGTVLLEAGEGQDGSKVFLVRVAGDRLTIEPVFTDVVVADFSPSGRHLLLMPHPSSDNVVSLVQWPQRRTVAELDSADLELNDDAFDFYGCFLNNDAVMIKTYEEGLLVARDVLTDVARVRFAGLDANENTTLDTVVGLGDDTVGVDVWHDGREHATIWRVSTT